MPQTSVRYIADPAMHKSAAAAAAAAQRKKKDSIMSDYEGLDQIVLTDMTTIPAGMVARWLYHIFRSYVFGPSGLKDYGSATLHSKI